MMGALCFSSSTYICDSGFTLELKSKLPLKLRLCTFFMLKNSQVLFAAMLPKETKRKWQPMQAQATRLRNQLPTLLVSFWKPFCLLQYNVLNVCASSHYSMKCSPDENFKNLHLPKCIRIGYRYQSVLCDHSRLYLDQFLNILFIPLVFKAALLILC